MINKVDVFVKRVKKYEVSEFDYTYVQFAKERPNMRFFGSWDSWSPI